MKLSVNQQRLLLAAVIIVGLLVLLFIGCSASTPAAPSPSGGTPTEEFVDDTVEAEAEAPAASTPAPVAPAPSTTASALEERVEQLIMATPYKVAVSFINPTNEADDFSINGDRSQLAASMIKLSVLLYALNQIDAGALSLTDPYSLLADDIVPGSGTMQYDPIGTAYTVADLIELMIAQSDNTATNVLIDRLGLAEINAYMDELGLDADLNKKLMVTGPEYYGVNNYLTADAVSAMLKRIYDGTAGSPAVLELVNQALLDQYDDVGIIDGLPPNTVIGHKTGTLDTVKNDGAIIYGEHPFILTILIEDTNGMDDPEALALMATISKEVYNACYAGEAG